MKPHTIAFAIGIGLLIVALGGGFSSDPVSPTPAPVDTQLSLDVLAAFKKTSSLAQARADAVSLGALCHSLAETSRYDAAQPDPRMRLGIHFDDLRRHAREYQFRGESLTPDYPELVDVIGKHFDVSVGVKGGPVDDEKRAQWAKAFDELSAACNYAAGKL